jgi:hypothetical protein
MARQAEDYAFMQGIDRIAGVLNGAAQKLDDLAESLEASDGELAEANAGKTTEEIAEEDALAAEIAAPVVNALDSISAILNEATSKMCGMTAELFEDCKEAEV